MGIVPARVMRRIKRDRNESPITLDPKFSYWIAGWYKSSLIYNWGPVFHMLSSDDQAKIVAKDSEPLGLLNLLRGDWKPPMPLLYWVSLERAQTDFLTEFQQIGSPTFISSSEVLTYDGQAEFVLIHRPWGDMFRAVTGKRLCI